MAQLNTHAERFQNERRRHRHPAIKFYDIKNKIFPQSDEPEVMPDEEDDSWLDEPPTDVAEPAAQVTTECHINVRSELLVDLLDDSGSASRTRNPPTDSSSMEGLGQDGMVEDNDFSMEF